MRENESPDPETGSESPRETRESTVGRRSYLKAGSGIALTLVGVTGIAATDGGAASYRTVTVDTNETKTYDIAEGETFENYLFDVSASGAHVDINATGTSGWSIRNVGFRGRDTASTKSNIITVKVPSGGHGSIENVYFGDGSDAGDGTPIFVHKDHAGVVNIHRCYFRHWSDNAVYGSAPGRDEVNPGYGDVRIDQCYSRNNNISNFRIGTDGSFVRDSVVHVDGPVPAQNGDGNARGVWVKEGGNCLIENCDILLEYPAAGYCVEEADDNQAGIARVHESEVEARDGASGRFYSKYGTVKTRNVGNDPYVAVPAGVPESAEDAATGGGLPAQIAFAGGSSTASLDYSFVTESGDVEAAESGSGAVCGNSASGSLDGGRDAYSVNGSLESVTIDYSAGDSDVSVRIERSTGSIRFEGGDADDRLKYYVRCRGRVTPGDDLEAGDAVGPKWAKGDTHARSGTDTLHYADDLACVWARYPADGSLLAFQYNTPH